MTDTTFEKALTLAEKLERVLAGARGQINEALIAMDKENYGDARRILRGFEKALR